MAKQRLLWTRKLLQSTHWLLTLRQACHPRFLLRYVIQSYRPKATAPLHPSYRPGVGAPPAELPSGHIPLSEGAGTQEIPRSGSSSQQESTSPRQTSTCLFLLAGHIDPGQFWTREWCGLTWIDWAPESWGERILQRQGIQLSHW